MRITVQGHAAATIRTDLLVIPVTEGKGRLGAVAARIDSAMGGLLSDLIAQEGFEGKPGECAVIRTFGKLPAGKVALLGAGKPGKGPATVRRLAALAARTARAERARSVALLLDGPSSGAGSAAAAATEGALLGDYRFLKYKDDERTRYAERMIEEFCLVMRDARAVGAAERGVVDGEIAARGTVLARSLVNEPASAMTPSRLMEVAVAIAAAHPDRIRVTVVDKKGLRKMGAEGILAVAKGSDEDPYLVHLVYTPKKRASRRVAIIGKGITFDSGGLSLKPSKAMEDMKIDMAGAAAVLGVFGVIADAAPGAEVHGIAALCENMPSGKATRPGDIVRTMSGKTVEVLNTDAEGRVTLADALHYAASTRPDAMIDLATLTGACMVALGQEVAGVMTNSDRLAKELLASGADAGELLWRLPLPEEYAPMMKGDVADLRNVSAAPYGGAITAGLFLKEFVGDIPWAHIDIAGPAWAETDTVPHQPKGATGFGVRTVLHYLKSI